MLRCDKQQNFNNSEVASFNVIWRSLGSPMSATCKITADMLMHTRNIIFRAREDHVLCVVMAVGGKSRTMLKRKMTILTRSHQLAWSFVRSNFIDKVFHLEKDIWKHINRRADLVKQLSAMNAALSGRLDVEILTDSFGIITLISMTPLN